MLFEYAVEPKAIGSSWESFRYLIEKFGFDRGRLISRFPKTWERQVIETAQQSGMKDVKFKSLVSRLQKAKVRALIRSGRECNPAAGDWLDNALKQHALEPFHAVIASENRGDQDFILVTDDMDEDHPLMIAPLNRDVPRTGKALAEAMSLLLKSAKKVRFIDRYFNIKKARYKETLKALLFVIAENGVNDVCCEIHFCNHKRRTPTEHVEQNAGNWLAGVIPEGMSVRTFVWQEKKGGADFHARYLLTDLGGMSVDAGFSAEGAHQTVLLSLLSHDLHEKKLSAFERNSTEYQLIKPVLEISSTGKVRQI